MTTKQTTKTQFKAAYRAARLYLWEDTAMGHLAQEVMYRREKAKQEALYAVSYGFIETLAIRHGRRAVEDWDTGRVSLIPR